MKSLLTLLIAVICNIASAQVITDDMENWKNYNAGFPFPTTPLEKPVGWSASDSLACTFGPLLDPGGTFVKQVFKTSDAHSGSFAVKLVTRPVGTIGVFPGVIANAAMSLDTSQDIPFKLHGGVPVTQRLDYVNAWIKYKPAVSGEETQMYAEAVIAGAGTNGDDSVIGTGTINIGETSNNYELISTSIDYINSTIVPTHIRVVFFSSFDNPNDGTELYVDDVTISQFPVEIRREFGNEDIVKVYPTVTTGAVTFEPFKVQPMNIKIFSQTGQLVAEEQLNGKTTLELNDLPQGMYFYSISFGTSPETWEQQGKLIIVR